ncbi:MAG: hypothetical protein HW407_1052, partial [Bacteroidetes bacterium]|nr:hypothetical protein [Bacteroidota bacterium]
MKRYPKRIKIVPVLSSDMTLDVWQRSPELVAEAMRLGKDH